MEVDPFRARLSFKIERFDEGETQDERDYLERHDFRIGKDGAYAGA